MSVLAILGTVALTATVIAAWKLPPPQRRLNGLALGLTVLAVVDGIMGILRDDGQMLLAIAVVSSAAATWLLRAPADEDDDEGGEPPGEPDPDAPDPGAFDWDEFDRECRKPSLWSG